MQPYICIKTKCLDSHTFIRFNVPHTSSQFIHSYQLGLMGHAAAGVAVGVHEQLGVGVDGDEGLDVAVALDQVHHVLHLNLRVSRGAVVGFRARVATSTRAWGWRS